MPVPLLPPPAFLPKRCWHLRIQPRTPAPVAPVGQGGLAALGVRWARGGRLTPSLLGRLLAPCPPCCPAKGKEEEGVGGSPQSPPHAAIPQPGSPGPRAMCTVATRGSSKIRNAFLPFFFPPWYLGSWCSGEAEVTHVTLERRRRRGGEGERVGDPQPSTCWVWREPGPPEMLQGTERRHPGCTGWGTLTRSPLGPGGPGIPSFPGGP